MPEDIEGASVPLVILQAVDAANITPAKTLATRRPHKGAKEHRRAYSSEWTDEDEPPRRKKKADRTGPSRRHERQSRSDGGQRVETSSSQSDLGWFFPRLSRILEGSDSPASSRSSIKRSEISRSGAEVYRKRVRHKDESGSAYRRPVRHRTTGVQRRSDSSFKINPSLLSVLTSLTNNSDRSSGSNSTITQHSYDRRGSNSSRTPTGRPRQTRSEVRSSVPDAAGSESPNVFDYMIPTQSQREHDRQSIMSSSSSSASSHYEPSVAGSSEAPDTPSSRSSLPSPDSMTRGSVNELRRKFDPQYACFVNPARNGSQSPELPVRLTRCAPSVDHVPEGDEDHVASAATVPDDDSRHRSSSASSRSSQRSAEHLRRQEERMRQHMAYAAQVQHNHYVNPVPSQHRSSSTSSGHSAHLAPSDQAAYAYHMAMQQYQSPQPPATSPPTMSQSMNGHITQADRPPVPDAPDFSQRTIAGYEMLALELSAAASPVQPLYRKFEYLNHRILLHLQDELSELEEQLRTVDEVIAQLEPACNDGQRIPSSRRAEAYSQSEIHHRRTALLGRIFMKMEQYNKAMAGYSSMLKDATPATKDQVGDYRIWMDKNAPIHEFETRFLHHASDLVLLGHSGVKNPEPTAKHAVLAYLPAALMLPLLLFSIIPSLAGRLAVTILIGAGAFMVAATTRIRALMEAREWAICGVGYVLVMAAVAGLIPQHG